MPRKSQDEANIIFTYVFDELRKITTVELRREGFYLPVYDHLLHVHISTSKSFFWNFYRKTIAYIVTKYQNWSILLIGGKVSTVIYENEDGTQYRKPPALMRIYDIPSRIYHERSEAYWTENEEEGFKINDEGDDLRDVPNFASLTELVNRQLAAVRPSS